VLEIVASKGESASTSRYKFAFIAWAEKAVFLGGKFENKKIIRR